MDHSETTSLATAIGTWGFSAHEYSEEQLVEAAFLMLNHALAVPELEKWRLPAGKFFDHTRNHGNLQGPVRLTKYLQLIWRISSWPAVLHTIRLSIIITFATWSM